MPGIDIYAEIGAGPFITTNQERLLHALQRARFDLMAVASARAVAGDFCAGNAEVEALISAVPQMRGWVVINPAHIDASAEELRRYLVSDRWLGAALVLPSRRDSLLSVTTRELINACRRYTRPLLLRIEDEIAVRELDALAAEFSTIKFIAGGSGGVSWPAAVISARQRPNIFLEPFSGESHQGKLERILEVLGPHRLLFASSYPIQNPGAALGLLADARITDAEKQSILSASAARLFGLSR